MNEQAYYENRALWEVPTGVDPFDASRYKKVLSLIPADSGSILDAGCGNGAFLDFSRRSGYPMIGLDRSSAAVAVARTAFKMPVMQGDASQLPFADAAFDVVIALEVLEHLPYGVYEHALSELERVARRYIIINVPNAEKRLFVTCQYCGTRYHPAYHLRSFTSDGLRHLFRRFELHRHEVVHSDQIDYTWYPRALKTYHAIFHPGTPGHVPVPAAARCPACGYGTGADRALKGLPGRGYRDRFASLKAGLLRLLPLRRYTEVVAVYRRCENGRDADPAAQAPYSHAI